MGPMPTAAEIARLSELLGRAPQAAFEIVARTADGEPAVIRNAPLLDDGTPMPTRYWLVDRHLVRRVSRVEADGGVRAAEAEIAPDAIRSAHDAYAAERDAALPASHSGPRPHGGVGGTRVGVKCLHAHYAHYLAGGDDPVGAWVAAPPRFGGRFMTRVAAVDIGTNSTRLLVADVSGHGADARLEPVQREMRITRLGEGVDAERTLRPDAIERTVAVLREYGEIIERLGATKVRATATSASRDARNRDDFFDPATDALRGACPSCSLV